MPSRSFCFALLALHFLSRFWKIASHSSCFALHLPWPTTLDHGNQQWNPRNQHKMGSVALLGKDIKKYYWHFTLSKFFHCHAVRFVKTKTCVASGRVCHVCRGRLFSAHKRFAQNTQQGLGDHGLPFALKTKRHSIH